MSQDRAPWRPTADASRRSQGGDWEARRPTGSRTSSGGTDRNGSSSGASGGRGQEGARGGRGEDGQRGRGGGRAGEERRRPAPEGWRGAAPRGGAVRREAGEFDNSERRGGPRLTPKGPRLPEPRIEEGITGKEIDRDVRGQLRTLSVENADGVAQHLVMVGIRLSEDNIDAAMAHAEVAVRRAGRVPAAREALGMVAYRQGDFARALTEFRTVRRLSGSSHLLPLMVDCERGLGRHNKALELASSPEAKTLSEAERIELVIVMAGIRRDLGQLDSALVSLGPLAKRRGPRSAAAARLYYCYADTLEASGDVASAREWFAKAADADSELETDAAERLDELDGIQFEDLLGEDDEGHHDGELPLPGGAKDAD